MTKNTDGIFKMLGASNHSKGERAEADFYASDPKAIDGLLSKEAFGRRIWEPACGMGHLSDRLRTFGHEVRESDLVLRKDGVEQMDFLLFNGEEWDGDIITNPPYSVAREFVEQSLRCVQGGRKVAMLLKLLFLESAERRVLFDAAPPVRIHVYSRRISCWKNGDASIGSGAMCYAWFVWEKGYKGSTTIDWI